MFHRIGRHIELTEAGRAFLQEAKAVLARVEAAELTLAELGELKRGVLNLAASQTIASYWLPRHLVSFRRNHPGIDIRLAIGNTTQAVRAGAEELVEIGFVEPSFLLSSTANPLERLDSPPDCRPRRSHVILNI